MAALVENIKLVDSKELTITRIDRVERFEAKKELLLSHNWIDILVSYMANELNMS